MNQFLPVGPQSFFIIQLRYYYNVSNYGLLKDVVTCCDVPAASVPQNSYEGTRKLHGQEFQRAFPGCTLKLCLPPPGSAWQGANKYTSTVVVTSLFCNFFVLMHTHSSSFFFALSLTTCTIPAIFTGCIAEKIIWFPFWQNIALLKSILKRLDGGGMDVRSIWHFEKL